MLILLSLIFAIAGAVCLNVYRPDWVRVDNVTRDRIDPFTEGEKVGGWFVFIAILLFALSFI